MNLLPFIELCLVVAGLLAAIAGHYFSLDKSLALGAFLLGAGLVLGGLESVFTQRMSFRFHASANEDYLGTPAVIFGLMQILVGGIAVAVAHLIAGGMWQATLTALYLRPWPLLAVLGPLLIGAGVLLMPEAKDLRGAIRSFAIGIPRAIAGLIVAAAGAAAAISGVWEWLDPGSFARLANLVSGDIYLQMAARWWRAAVTALR